jgi:hypothetical protein
MSQNSNYSRPYTPQSITADNERLANSNRTYKVAKNQFNMDLAETSKLHTLNEEIAVEGNDVNEYDTGNGSDVSDYGSAKGEDSPLSDDFMSAIGSEGTEFNDEQGTIFNGVCFLATDMDGQVQLKDCIDKFNIVIPSLFGKDIENLVKLTFIDLIQLTKKVVNEEKEINIMKDIAFKPSVITDKQEEEKDKSVLGPLKRAREGYDNDNDDNDNDNNYNKQIKHRNLKLNITRDEEDLISGLFLVKSQTSASFILPANLLYKISNIISYQLYTHALSQLKPESEPRQLLIPDNPIEGFLNDYNRINNFSQGSKMDDDRINLDEGNNNDPPGDYDGGDLDEGDDFDYQPPPEYHGDDFAKGSDLDDFDYQPPGGYDTDFSFLNEELHVLENIQLNYTSSKIRDIETEVKKELSKGDKTNISYLCGLLYNLSIFYEVQELSNSSKSSLDVAGGGGEMSDNSSSSGSEREFNKDTIKECVAVYEFLCLESPILMLILSINDCFDDNFKNNPKTLVFNDEILSTMREIQGYLNILIQGGGTPLEKNIDFITMIIKTEEDIIKDFIYDGGECIGVKNKGMSGGGNSSIIQEIAYVKLSGDETEHDLSPKTGRIKEILKKIKNSSIYDNLFDKIKQWYSLPGNIVTFPPLVPGSEDEKLYNIINRPFPGESSFYKNVWEYLLLTYPERFDIVYAADKTFVFKASNTVLSPSAIEALRQDLPTGGTESDEAVKERVFTECRNLLLGDIYTKYEKDIPLLLNPRDTINEFHATVMEPNVTIMGSKGENYLGVAQDMVLSKKTCTGFNSMGLIKHDYDNIMLSNPRPDVDNLTDLFFPGDNSYLSGQITHMNKAAEMMPEVLMYATIFDPAFTGNNADLENMTLKQSPQLFAMYVALGIPAPFTIDDIKAQFGAFIVVADISAANKCLNVLINNKKIITSSELLNNGYPINAGSPTANGLKYYYGPVEDNREAFTIGIGDFAVSSVVETIIFLKAALDSMNINLNDPYNHAALQRIIDNCTSYNYIRLYKYAHFVINHTDFRFDRTWQVFFVIIVYAKTTGDRKQRETADIINSFIKYRDPRSNKDEYFDNYPDHPSEFADIMTILYPDATEDDVLPHTETLTEINKILKLVALYTDDQIMATATGCSKTIILNSLKPSVDLSPESEAFMCLWQEDMKKYMGAASSSGGGVFISFGDGLYAEDLEAQRNIKKEEINTSLALIFYKLYSDEFKAGRFDEDTYINTCLEKVIEEGGLPVASTSVSAAGGNNPNKDPNYRLNNTDLTELNTFIQTLRLILNYLKYVSLDETAEATTMKYLIDLEILTNIASITDPEQKRLIGFLGKITSSNIPGLITTNASNKALVDTLLASRIKATKSVKNMIDSHKQYFMNLHLSKNSYLKFIGGDNIAKITSDLDKANDHINDKQQKVMETILKDLQESIRIAAIQEQNRRPERGAKLAALNAGLADNSKSIKILDDISSLKRDLNVQIKKLSNIEKELADAENDISNKKAGIIVQKLELKKVIKASNAAAKASNAAKSAARGAAKQPAVKFTNSIKSLQQQIQLEETQLQETIKAQKENKKRQKEETKKIESLKLSLDTKSKLSETEAKKTTFFSYCVKTCQSLREGYENIKGTFEQNLRSVFSGGSINKSSKTKKTTKKHYRKQYNTKKKQARQFVKKTKMNRRRVSKQSRRRH